MLCRHISRRTFIRGALCAIKSSMYGLALSTSTQLRNSCSALNGTKVITIIKVTVIYKQVVLTF